MPAHDLIVVGGGLVGGAIAWGAAREDASVALLDEGDLAFRAARQFRPGLDAEQRRRQLALCSLDPSRLRAVAHTRRDP
jgi:glycine/D-amino acid oxidase-like deaminating enzyme